MEHFICNKCGNVVFKDDPKCMNCGNDMESIITYSVNEEISKYDSNCKWSLSFALISFFSTFFLFGSVASLFSGISISNFCIIILFSGIVSIRHFISAYKLAKLSNNETIAKGILYYFLFISICFLICYYC